MCVYALMGRKAAQRSKGMRGDAACVREEGYLYPSIDHHRGRAQLRAISYGGRGGCGEVVAMVILCLS